MCKNIFFDYDSPEVNARCWNRYYLPLIIRAKVFFCSFVCFFKPGSAEPLASSQAILVYKVVLASSFCYNKLLATVCIKNDTNVLSYDSGSENSKISFTGLQLTWQQNYVPAEGSRSESACLNFCRFYKDCPCSLLCISSPL